MRNKLNVTSSRDHVDRARAKYAPTSMSSMANHIHSTMFNQYTFFISIAHSYTAWRLRSYPPVLSLLSKRSASGQPLPSIDVVAQFCAGRQKFVLARKYLLRNC